MIHPSSSAEWDDVLMEIKPVRIRCYRNPLGRLVKLHQSYQEMSTGLVYRSPFEREDARFR